jgi:hypothetical protein
MASVLFEAYNHNLRRVYLAEFIDDHRQSQDPWRRRVSPNGTLVSEAVKAEIRSKLLFYADVCSAPS